LSTALSSISFDQIFGRSGFITAHLKNAGSATIVTRQPSCPVPTTTLAGFEAAGVGVSFGVFA
jgi:hypothetical protein